MKENYSQWRKQVALLSDDELLSTMLSLSDDERGKTAWHVAHLAEVIRRELALKRAHGSPYQYARKVLKLSDTQAGDRVDAARLALQLPETIERIASAELTLASAGVLYRGIRDAQKPAVAHAPKKAIASAQTGFALAPTATSAPMPAAGPTAAATSAPTAVVPAPTPAPLPPVSSDEKKDLLSQVLGKSRRESLSLLDEWQCARDPQAVPASRQCPKSLRKPVRGGWTELGFHLNDAELAEWDRLRDLLSHKLKSRDPQAVFAWMLAQALERVDPVRKQDRVDARKGRHAVRVEKGAQIKSQDLLTQRTVAPTTLPHSKNQLLLTQ